MIEKLSRTKLLVQLRRVGREYGDATVQFHILDFLAVSAERLRTRAEAAAGVGVPGNQERKRRTHATRRRT